jgi:hypothetical protein
MTIQIKNMILQVTVTMVPTLVLEEELHLTLLRGTGSKDLPTTNANHKGDSLRRNTLIHQG